MLFYFIVGERKMNLDELMEGAETLSEDIDFYKPEISNDKLYPRCVYLLVSLKITLPRIFSNHIPFYEEIVKPQSLWVPMIQKEYAKGKTLGEGSIDELKLILDLIIFPELKNYEERKKFVNFLESLSSGLFHTNIEKPISKVSGKEIEKWNSGFAPIDKALGGFYQGVFAIAGLPGSGKTSIVLNLAANFAKNYPVWYYQTEIPSSLIESRIKLLEPEKWNKDSYFHAGNYNTTTILEKVQRSPNPNRIIIYDSPEIIDMSKSSDLLYYFMKTYQDLVQIKHHSKLVIVTSQLKQNLKWEDLDNPYCLNDSASKARYLDGIIYLGSFVDNLMIKLGKNRFGSPNGSSMVKYNYETMQLEDDFVTDLFD